MTQPVTLPMTDKAYRELFGRDRPQQEQTVQLEYGRIINKQPPIDEENDLPALRAKAVAAGITDLDSKTADQIKALFTSPVRTTQPVNAEPVRRRVRTEKPEPEEIKYPTPQIKPEELKLQPEPVRRRRVVVTDTKTDLETINKNLETLGLDNLDAYEIKFNTLTPKEITYLKSDRKPLVEAFIRLKQDNPNREVTQEMIDQDLKNTSWEEVEVKQGVNDTKIRDRIANLISPEVSRNFKYDTLNQDEMAILNSDDDKEIRALVNFKLRNPNKTYPFAAEYVALVIEKKAPLEVKVPEKKTTEPKPKFTPREFKEHKRYKTGLFEVPIFSFNQYNYDQEPFKQTLETYNRAFVYKLKSRGFKPLVRNDVKEMQPDYSNKFWNSTLISAIIKGQPQSNTYTSAYMCAIKGDSYTRRVVEAIGIDIIPYRYWYDMIYLLGDRNDKTEIKDVKKIVELKPEALLKLLKDAGYPNEASTEYPALLLAGLTGLTVAKGVKPNDYRAQDPSKLHPRVKALYSSDKSMLKSNLTLESSLYTRDFGYDHPLLSLVELGATEFSYTYGIALQPQWTDEEAFRYIINNFGAYGYYMHRDQPAKANVQITNQNYTAYNDDELFSIGRLDVRDILGRIFPYDDNVVIWTDQRIQLVHSVIQLLGKQSRWSYNNKFCTNEGNVDVIEMEPKNYSGLFRVKDPVFAFGNMQTGFTCWSASEIANSFREDQGMYTLILEDFKKETKDNKPNKITLTESEISDLLDVVISAKSRGYIIDDYAALHKSLTKAAEQSRSLAGSFNRIKLQLAGLTANQRKIFDNYIAYLFELSMYLRRWKGPGYPWPARWSETGGIDLCSDEDQAINISNMTSKFYKFFGIPGNNRYEEIKAEDPQLIPLLKSISYYKYDWKNDKVEKMAISQLAPGPDRPEYIYYYVVNALNPYARLGENRQYCLADASGRFLDTAYSILRNVYGFDVAGINTFMNDYLKANGYRGRQPRFSPNDVTATGHIDPMMQMRNLEFR